MKYEEKISPSKIENNTFPQKPEKIVKIPNISLLSINKNMQ